MISLPLVSKNLLVILLPFLIFLANFNYLAFNRNFFENLQQKIESDLNLETRIKSTNNVVDFYQGKIMLDQNIYSHQAQLHLEDVKKLLAATRIIIGMNIIIVLSLIIIIVHEKKYEIIFTSLAHGCLFTIGFLLLLGFGVFKHFDELFLGMHKVIFRDDLWLFPSTDTLVQIFPAEFFVLFANQLVINTTVTCIFLFALAQAGKILARKTINGNSKGN